MPIGAKATGHRRALAEQDRAHIARRDMIENALVQPQGLEIGRGYA